MTRSGCAPLRQGLFHLWACVKTANLPKAGEVDPASRATRRTSPCSWRLLRSADNWLSRKCGESLQEGA